MEQKEFVGNAMVFFVLLIGTFTAVVGVGAISTWLDTAQPTFADQTFQTGVLLSLVGLGLIGAAASYYLGKA